MVYICEGVGCSIGQIQKTNPIKLLRTKCCMNAVIACRGGCRLAFSASDLGRWLGCSWLLLGVSSNPEDEIELGLWR